MKFIKGIQSIIFLPILVKAIPKSNVCYIPGNKNAFEKLLPDNEKEKS